jgi:hypothetical protein
MYGGVVVLLHHSHARRQVEVGGQLQTTAALTHYGKQFPVHIVLV